VAVQKADSNRGVKPCMRVVDGPEGAEEVA
ncbi:uncharacterized protein METZ01_LOCUS224119, partial [marine metagenome]